MRFLFDSLTFSFPVLVFFGGWWFFSDYFVVKFYCHTINCLHYFIPLFSVFIKAFTQSLLRSLNTFLIAIQKSFSSVSKVKLLLLGLIAKWLLASGGGFLSWLSMVVFLYYYLGTWS